MACHAPYSWCCLVGGVNASQYILCSKLSRRLMQVIRKAQWSTSNGITLPSMYTNQKELQIIGNNDPLRWISAFFQLCPKTDGCIWVSLWLQLNAIHVFEMHIRWSIRLVQSFCSTPLRTPAFHCSNSFSLKPLTNDNDTNHNFVCAGGARHHDNTSFHICGPCS